MLHKMPIEICYSNMAAEHLVKIKFPLTKDDEGFPPADAEILWARACGGGVFVIDNIPFFVKLVSCGDKVSTTVNRAGELYVNHIAHSKHSTLRVVVFDETRVAAV